RTITVTTTTTAEPNTITMTVTTEPTAAPTTSAPQFNSIGDKQVNEGQTLTFTINASNSNDDLTYSASNLPPGASFNPEERRFSWVPAVGQADTYSNIRFTVTDSDLDDNEDITITVTGAELNSALVSELHTFNVMPLYDEKDQLTFARINYEINGISPITTDAKVIVTVMLDGNWFDEITIIPSGENQSNKFEDVIYYQPPPGMAKWNLFFRRRVLCW
ncbi:Ig domain-containing protein, partial [Chloroflexota bacterium]